MGYHSTRYGVFRADEREPRSDVEHWWRAEDRRYADYDPWAEFEQPTSSHLAVEIRCYPVVRHTPRGVWLDCGFGGKRFVRGDAVKQFAVPTRELALADLIARKKRHVAGAQARLRRAEEHLAAAERMLERTMAHKCSNGASDTTDNDLQRPDPAR